MNCCRDFDVGLVQAGNESQSSNSLEINTPVQRDSLCPEPEMRSLQNCGDNDSDNSDIQNFVRILGRCTCSGNLESEKEDFWNQVESSKKGLVASQTEGLAPRNQYENTSSNGEGQQEEDYKLQSDENYSFPDRRRKIPSSPREIELFPQNSYLQKRRGGITKTRDRQSTSKIYTHEKMNTEAPLREINNTTKGWVAKIRVQEKMQIRESKNPPGKKFQKLILIDDHGDRVIATLFDETIDLLQNKLIPFKTYLVSGATIKDVDSKFQIDGISKEWLLSPGSIIQEVNDNPLEVMETNFTLTPLNTLPSYADELVDLDILAVVIDVQSAKPYTSTFGGGFRRQMTIIDTKLTTFAIALWDNFALNEGAKLYELQFTYPIICCRRIRATSFNGFTLKTKADSAILINPPLVEARKLKLQMQLLNDEIAEGGSTHFDPTLLFQHSKKVNPIAKMQATDKIIWIRGYMMFRNPQKECWFMACKKCHRKTNAEFKESFPCNYCHEDQIAEPRCRFELDVFDESGNITIAVFGNTAEEILQISAIEAMKLNDENLHLYIQIASSKLQNKLFLLQVRPGRKKSIHDKMSYILHSYFEVFPAQTTSATKSQLESTHEDEMQMGSQDIVRSLSKKPKRD